MAVTVGKQFTKDVNQFVRDIEGWSADIDDKMEHVFRVTAERWKGEAQRRVPESPASGTKRNEKGQFIKGSGTKKAHLHQRVLSNVYWIGAGIHGELFMEVGSNLDHSVYVEFGTERIAKGRVKALGYGPNVTDADAIKDWPAKHVDGATRDQMPWLRPAWWSINDDFIAMMDFIGVPPLQGEHR